MESPVHKRVLNILSVPLDHGPSTAGYGRSSSGRRDQGSAGGRDRRVGEAMAVGEVEEEAGAERSEDEAIAKALQEEKLKL